MTCYFLPGRLEELAEEGPLDYNQITELFSCYAVLQEYRGSWSEGSTLQENG